MPVESLLLSRDAEVVRVMRRVLDELGVRLQVTTSASEATDINSRRKFEAVIVDCDDVGGTHEMLRALRAGPSNRGAITFVIVNGKTSVPSAFELGANFVFDKPLSFERTLRTFRAAHGLLLRERRRYIRHEVNIPALLQLAGQPLKATITNLSEGGMALRTPQKLPENVTVRVSFTLPGGSRALDCRGEVAWNASEGAGLRFVFIAENIKAELSAWLNRMADTEDPLPLFINASRATAKTRD